MWRRRVHWSKENVSPSSISSVPHQLDPSVASKVSHSHCFCFNLQTASMFYVEELAEHTISVFIYYSGRAVKDQKEERGIGTRVSFHCRAQVPGQNHVFLLSYFALCWFCYCQYFLLNYAWVKKLKNFFIDRLRSGRSAVLEVVHFLLNGALQ